jgi:uncharacterized cofD-like protein
MTPPASTNDLKIAVIGGGTGSFTLLTGLKEYTSALTALVNMADDGGSTGVLRDELGVLPPGDVRQCLVALSDAPKLRELFNYRFDEGGLKGHSFGNLFLTALEKMTGNFAEGVELAAEVLHITGVVEPITLTNVRLIIRTKAHGELKGEHWVDESNFLGERPELLLEPEAIANPKALQAIKDADIVVIAPGDIYGSLGPALIVPGVGEALARSKAFKVYVCNLVTKPGQEGFLVTDFAGEIERLAGQTFLDAVLYNTREPGSELMKKYAKAGELAVGYDTSKLEAASYRTYGGDLLAGAIWENKSGSADLIAASRTLIRHDPIVVARSIVDLYRSQFQK